LKTRKIVFILLIAFFLFPICPSSGASAASWTVNYSSSVGTIKALAGYNDKLYAGGFTGQSNAHLFVYDGTSWSDLNFSPGSGGSLNMIEALQAFNNKLYIGTRVQVGNSFFSRVYSYDGTSFVQEFSTAGHGSCSGIEDLAIHENNLYAANGACGKGEVFQRIGDNNWSTVGGLVTPAGDAARALASYKGNLYTGTGTGQGANVWCWNGTAWGLSANMSTLFGVNQNGVMSLAADNDFLYAGTAGPTGAASIIPAYDGVSWKNSISVTGNVRLSVINNHIWAGTGNGNVYWNDGSWQGFGVVSNVYEFAEYKAYIYAAGSNGSIYRTESPNRYSITGKIADTNGKAIPNVVVSDGTGQTTVSNSLGIYTLSNLIGGQYTVAPVLSGYNFTPVSLTITVPPDLKNQNFTETTKLLNVNISLYTNPAEGQARIPYEKIVGYFADGVFEESNGGRKLGNVTFHSSNADSSQANVVWVENCHPSANVAGFGINGLHVNMCDIFKDGMGKGLNYDFLSDDAHQKGGGYALAHEWGHYYFSLYDEYVGDASDDTIFHYPHSTDEAVSNSIMNSQWNAIGGNFNWLNFSVANNNLKTAQYRVYGASGWNTLVRPVSEDPRDGERKSLPTRLFYSDLQEVAPGTNQGAAIDLPGTGRSSLSIVWETVPASITPTNQLANLTYTAQLSSILGQNISSPDPILLMAFVQKDLLLTDVGVHGNVQLPDGSFLPVMFTDDGNPPDAMKGDGLYSAILGYQTNGIYTIQIQFENNAGLANMVSTAFQPSLGANGQPIPVSNPIPVTESFIVSKTMQVVVGNVLADDYGNTIGDAKLISSDNKSFSGKIDYAGDEDDFQFPTLIGEITYVRVTNLALGMKPHLRLIGADGIAVLFDAHLDIAFADYLDIPLIGVLPGDTIYAEISDSSNSSGGLYDLSVGTKLASDSSRVFSLHLPYVTH
jgi:hypothetical protein